MTRYCKSASEDVKRAVKRQKKGKPKSGKGGKVKSRRQVIAIGLSEARKKARRFQRRKNPAGKRKRTEARPQASHIRQ